MKFGFDINGVITKRPGLFAEITNRLIAEGHEVHIITGFNHSDYMEKHLEDMGIDWTDFFSVPDWLRTPEGKHSSRNRAKAEYCARENIDLHIDDSEVYGQYFTTPYLRFKVNEHTTTKPAQWTR